MNMQELQALLAEIERGDHNNRLFEQKRNLVQDLIRRYPYHRVQGVMPIPHVQLNTNIEDERTLKNWSQGVGLRTICPDSNNIWYVS